MLRRKTFARCRCKFRSIRSVRTVVVSFDTFSGSWHGRKDRISRRSATKKPWIWLSQRSYIMAEINMLLDRVRKKSLQYSNFYAYRNFIKYQRFSKFFPAHNLLEICNLLNITRHLKPCEPRVSYDALWQCCWRTNSPESWRLVISSYIIK